jgi:D-alanine-D-alanine ligase
MGGRSSEREVSLSSGRQVYYNLDRSKYSGVPIFMDRAGRLWRMPEKLVLQNTCGDVEARLTADAERLGLEDLPEAVDLVFNALHGKYGDDGCIQGVLELVGMPYTGSGVLACALSLDKPMAHALLAAAGFDLPREIVIGTADWGADPDACIGRAVETVGLPAVVLPAREGSSVGVAVVRDPEDYFDAIDAALAYDNRVLVEEFLDGLEFSVILVGNLTGSVDGSDPIQAFLPTETTTDNPFMTYDDKYMPGRSQKITPARVDAVTLARIQSEAVRAYRALGFQGYARLDGFLMPDGRLLFTDPNSTSGMAPSSFMFHQAAEAGLTPAALIDRILTLAVEAHAAKRGPL